VKKRLECRFQSFGVIPKMKVERNMKDVKSIRITTIVDNDVWKEGLCNQLAIHI
jgi:hypothetical protein